MMNPKRKTMRAPLVDEVQPNGAPHLSVSRDEARLTEFEQSMICVTEAFYRFAGALLGPTGAEWNLTGQDCVILQQIVAARRPSRLADLMRFANRDDTANVQYTLKKLARAGLVTTVPGRARRDTGYVTTDRGAMISARLVADRRALMVAPIRDLGVLPEQVRAMTEAMAVLTGLYDRGTRSLAARGPGEDDDPVPQPRS